MNCEMFIVLAQKSSIVSLKKYYRFMKKVLSFYEKSTIVFCGR